MQTHRKLTVIGVILLLATFLLNDDYQQDGQGDGFNYAYVTGIAMLATFMASFFMFSREKRASRAG